MSQIEFLTGVRPVQFPIEWYDMNSEQHFWFQWRAKVAAALIDRLGIPVAEHLRVLDIGCGTGITCRQLASRTKWTFDGTDLNVSALDRCEIGQGRVLYYDILEERPELANAYDVAILFDTLEHVEHTREFLKAVFHHLKPGGTLLVNVPALLSLFSIYDKVAGHYRRYTKATLAGEFAAFDAPVLDQVYWGFSMVPFLWLRQRVLSASMSESEVIRTGFVPPRRWIHTILKTVMRAETSLLRNPPAGSSLMSAVRKGKAL